MLLADLAVCYTYRYENYRYENYTKYSSLKFYFWIQDAANKTIID